LLEIQAEIWNSEKGFDFFPKFRVLYGCLYINRESVWYGTSPRFGAVASEKTLFS